MRVYWYFLTNGPKGIRETQKDLHLSSPSTASYQLKKLVDLNLLRKIDDTDKYTINNKINTGILGLFVLIGHYMIPKVFLFFLFNILVFTVLLTFTLFNNLILNPVYDVCLTDLLFNSFLSIIQTFKIWKLRPI